MESDSVEYALPETLDSLKETLDYILKQDFSEERKKFFQEKSSEIQHNIVLCHARLNQKKQATGEDAEHYLQKIWRDYQHILQALTEIYAPEVGSYDAFNPDSVILDYKKYLNTESEYLKVLHQAMSIPFLGELKDPKLDLDSLAERIKNSPSRNIRNSLFKMMALQIVYENRYMIRSDFQKCPQLSGLSALEKKELYQCCQDIKNIKTYQLRNQWIEKNEKHLTKIYESRNWVHSYQKRMKHTLDSEKSWTGMFQLVLEYFYWIKEKIIGNPLINEARNSLIFSHNLKENQKRYMSYMSEVAKQPLESERKKSSPFV